MVRTVSPPSLKARSSSQSWSRAPTKRIYCHYEMYRDPQSRPLDGVQMPIGITMEQYFAYANVDAAQHRFRPTRAVPWLAKVFGI